ncbi:MULTISPECIES: HK97 family phage prohead protease [unclassified Bradyrhizobium]|uniref:HK97 family phage prohead protease n=1 Tax=unclassified Bradyrhizobium TaxID=2631580 RepID=UPI001FFB94CC|nr:MULTISPECIES: HK97 family phage prohead protease [unclassified Bradyrhizobium]MCK1669251.1 HK97 family phage prohead protease [Bradyrhizobium sp. 153]MCK1755853.1 HK97 family phage prohead protease [Bradyrhizobium sp. 137]
MSALVHKTTESDVDLNRLDFILSEPLPDHYDDIVGNSKDTKTGGWEIPQRNLPALAFHDSKSIVGRWDGVRWERGALRGRLVLAPSGTSKIVDEVRALIKSGCLKACSVGFRALERLPRPTGGWHYLRQLLIECSLVATPALPSALLEAKRLGVSNETIKKIFKEQNENRTIAERIKQARANVKHYSAQERAAVIRKAKEVLARSSKHQQKANSKTQPKLLPARLPPLLSPQQKERIEQDKYNAEVLRRAREQVKIYEKEKVARKHQEYLARRDPPTLDIESYVTWRGQKFPYRG